MNLISIVLTCTSLHEQKQRITNKNKQKVANKMLVAGDEENLFKITKQFIL